MGSTYVHVRLEASPTLQPVSEPARSFKAPSNRSLR